MRFLKRKIAQANAYLTSKALKQTTASEVPSLGDLGTPSTDSGSQKSPQKSKLRNKSQASSAALDTNNTRETKNLVKNFGKAICNFINSHISLPYLEPLLKKEGLLLKDFIDYFSQNKVTIEGLHKFRSLLLTFEDDSDQVKSFKKVFREIGEIFIKYFSVNWIYHGRVQYKEAHLKFRFKMLRRIRQPELFTYLKAGKEKC